MRTKGYALAAIAWQIPARSDFNAPAGTSMLGFSPAPEERRPSAMGLSWCSR